jgi:hypothetical protein
MRNGFSQSGAPSGSKWANEAFGAFTNVDIMKDIHIGSPKDRVKIRWLDNLNVYGIKPNKLIRIIEEKIGVIIEPDPFSCMV